MYKDMQKCPCSCGFGKSMYVPWGIPLKALFTPNEDYKKILFKVFYFIQIHDWLLFLIPIWGIPVIMVLAFWYLLSLVADMYEYLGMKFVNFMCWLSDKVVELDATSKKMKG